MKTSVDKINSDSMVEAAAGTVVQTKLAIGAVNDPLEAAADAMADRVMRMPEPVDAVSTTHTAVQRKCAHCEEEETARRKPLASFIQKKGSEGGTMASDAVTAQISSSRGSGIRMDGATQSFMESRFGTDFSNVNIHTGSEAEQMNRELNAKAFTVGSDIYFNSGQYNPGTVEGKHLLAHELTHTVQQGGSSEIQRQFIQRYPWPYPLRMNHEVDESITETISGAPAAHSAWNNTFTWDSRYRIELNAFTGELKMIVRLNTTAPAATRRAWERAIEQKWSNRMYLRITLPGVAQGPCKFPIIVDLRWTDNPARAHYTIAPQTVGTTAGGRAGLGGTTSMTGWGTADTTDITHEFGHMIGNRDEYFITNGTNYMTGGAAGFRDAGAGIMNNPVERIHRRHFDSLRRHVASMLGLRNSAVRVMYDNDTVPDCVADIGDFPMPSSREGGTRYA